MSHKLGIIGYGGMACWHHDSIKANFDDLTVVAAYDIDEKRRGLAKAVVSRYSIRRRNS